MRRPFSLGVQERSRQTGYMHDLIRDGWETITLKESAAGSYPPEFIPAMFEGYKKEMQWVSETNSILDDRDRALEMMAVLEKEL